MVMVILILLVWRIGFGVMGLELAGMFSEAAMAEPWDGVGTTMMVGTHKA
jgi:hypothetical protein